LKHISISSNTSSSWCGSSRRFDCRKHF